MKIENLKKRMKPQNIHRSLKTQMSMVFVGLLICLVAAFMIINGRFLEPYYISNKESRFIELYENLNNVSNDDDWDAKKKNDSLLHFAEKNNISYLVIEKDNDVHTNVHDKNMLKNQLMGYFLNQAQKESSVLKSTDNYQITRSWDPWNQNYYIEMWGNLDDGSQFLLRSPVESIKESAAISNRFLLYIGSILIVITVLLIWYFSKRITEPLRELARLSDRMADLDFEAKYTSGGSNEIGELGANFNRMSEKLESTISELKKANNSLQKDIEQKDKLEKMRNEFLGNVSHELKTPIALIQGYAEGLKEGVNEDAESRDFYCDVIMDEAAKMNRMVKNLLTLNQLEFGDEDIVFDRFNLTALIRGVLQSMEILADQADATVNFRQTEDIYVWADEFKVEQVVRNYVSNAFHHVSGDKVIEVKMIVEGDKVRVTVFNTGTPIPEEDIGHIWDKFYKVDKAHTREYGGNGIGLSIVKAIMKSFHQQYGVKNYDNGVEFWFELDVK
nr:HAMP domain-containing sensor histidine kinase [uncultured Dorea sp.]